jgi:hypothetical protein
VIAKTAAKYQEAFTRLTGKIACRPAGIDPSTHRATP